MATSSNGGSSTPLSVTYPVTSSLGVMSNAGLKTLTPFGAMRLPLIMVTSAGSRSSILTWSALLLKSKVDLGKTE